VTARDLRSLSEVEGNEHVKRTEQASGHFNYIYLIHFNFRSVRHNPSQIGFGSILRNIKVNFILVWVYTDPMIEEPKTPKPEKPKQLDPETEKEIAEQVGFTLEQDSQMFEG
jgi:formylmethanofuran dehydrogenase subunit B